MFYAKINLHRLFILQQLLLLKLLLSTGLRLGYPGTGIALLTTLYLPCTLLK